MKYLFTLALATLLASSALAGSTNVAIDCTDISKKIVLKAFVPGDESDAVVQVSYNGKSQSFLNYFAVTNLKQNGKDPATEYPGFLDAVITTFDEVVDYKVFTITVSQAGGHNGTKLTLVADPRTVRIRARNYERKGTFSGKMWVELNPLGETKVSCTYDYSV